HQIDNPVQHLMEVLGQLIEIIVCTASGNTKGEVAVHDTARGVVDNLYAPRSTATHQKTTQQCQRQGNPHAPVDGRFDHTLQVGEIIHITANQQAEPALHIKDSGTGLSFRPLPANTGFQSEVDPATVG